MKKKLLIAGKPVPLTYPLAKIFAPSTFQGGNKKSNHFEGWYFKIVKDNFVCAFIPGISYPKNGVDAHSFIQFIDGRTCRTEYFKFPVNAFSYDPQSFIVEIAGNRFSLDGFSLNLGKGRNSISADIKFNNPLLWKPALFAPSVMGWFSYVPFLECFHHVVSFDHGLNGRIRFGTRAVSLSGGHGYVEKDWGQSFPSAWIWMQSNSFDTPRTSCMISLANIPWLGARFTGFIVVVVVAGIPHTFATWNGARILQKSWDKKTVSIHIKRGEYELEIESQRGAPCKLVAPKLGTMSRIIKESITGKISLKLSKFGKTIFLETGENAEIEAVGDITVL